MKKYNLLGFVGAILLSVSTVVDAAGNAERGAELSSACFLCHGKEGVSSNSKFPHLAGMQAAYIAKQVFDFQDEKRTNKIMVSLSYAVASKEDAMDIGAYFESQHPMKGEPLDGELVKKGADLYGGRGCSTCHGIAGEGKGNLFPRIGGQHLYYLDKTLKDFRSGERTSDRSGMMAPLTMTLTDEEIKALASYISSL